MIMAFVMTQLSVFRLNRNNEKIKTYMKIKFIFSLLFLYVSATSFGQKKDIRICPGPLPKKPEPVVIFDGIKSPSSIIKDILNEENKKNIDSVSIQLDSIFDCNGKLIHIGMVKIYTKDSLNLGAKKILTLTDDWLYKHPLSRLMINNTYVEWDENTYHKLISLKPDDIIYAEVIEGEKNKCNSTLKLKLKE